MIMSPPKSYEGHFTVFDQIATARILYELRQECPQSPDNVMSCPTVTKQRKISSSSVEGSHNDMVSQGNTNSVSIKPLRMDTSISQKLPSHTPMLFESSDSKKRTFEFFSNDKQFVPMNNQEKIRRVSFIHSGNISEDEGSSCIPCGPISAQNNSDNDFNFRGLIHPPILPSPGMNLSGLNFPIFFPPRQGKIEQGYICQEIVSIGRLNFCLLVFPCYCTRSNEFILIELISNSFHILFILVHPQEKPQVHCDGMDKVKHQGRLQPSSTAMSKAETNSSNVSLEETKPKRKRRSYKKKFKVCRMHECTESAAKNTPYCAKHSGTRICEFEGCKKCAQGRTRFCIAHGGGRRCTFPGCNKGARDHRFCAAHGGGRRCKVENCDKSAVGGTFKCSAHGGGRRCQFENCDKCAQSGTKFCVKHGGGKRCIIVGCSKVARGKSNLCMCHRYMGKSPEANEKLK